MRMLNTIVAFLALASGLAGAQALDRSAPLDGRLELGRMINMKPELVMQNGVLISSTMPSGTTKYEYNGKQLVKKLLPNGVSVDYFYDRSGRFVEARFSTGLVRTAHYDRTGRLTVVIGSDGYNVNLTGRGSRDGTAVVTGPNDYRFDMTPKLKEVRQALLKGQPLHADLSIGDFGDCYGDDEFGSCNWGGGGGGGGGYDFGGDYGGDYGAGWGPGVDPRKSYERCMSSICDPADKTFRNYCDDEPPAKRFLCHEVATREYWACENSCRP